MSNLLLSLSQQTFARSPQGQTRPGVSLAAASASSCFVSPSICWENEIPCSAASVTLCVLSHRVYRYNMPLHLSGTNWYIGGDSVGFEVVLGFRLGQVRRRCSFRVRDTKIVIHYARDVGAVAFQDAFFHFCLFGD